MRQAFILNERASWANKIVACILLAKRYSYRQRKGFWCGTATVYVRYSQFHSLTWSRMMWSHAWAHYIHSRSRCTLTDNALTMLYQVLIFKVCSVSLIFGTAQPLLINFHCGMATDVLAIPLLPAILLCYYNACMHVNKHGVTLRLYWSLNIISTENKIAVMNTV